MRTQLHIHTHMFINICTYGLATCTDFLGNAVVRVVDGAATAAASVWLCVCVYVCIWHLQNTRTSCNKQQFEIRNHHNSQFAIRIHRQPR